jgi:hypothetical protein
MLPALREVTLPALRRIGRISAQGLLEMDNGRMIEATTTTPQTPARGHIAAQWRGSLAGCSARAAGDDPDRRPCQRPLVSSR